MANNVNLNQLVAKQPKAPKGPQAPGGKENPFGGGNTNIINNGGTINIFQGQNPQKTLRDVGKQGLGNSKNASDLSGILSGQQRNINHTNFRQGNDGPSIFGCGHQDQDNWGSFYRSNDHGGIGQFGDHDRNHCDMKHTEAKNECSQKEVTGSLKPSSNQPTTIAYANPVQQQPEQPAQQKQCSGGGSCGGGQKQSSGSGLSSTLGVLAGVAGLALTGLGIYSYFKKDDKKAASGESTGSSKGIRTAASAEGANESNNGASDAKNASNSSSKPSSAATQVGEIKTPSQVTASIKSDLTKSAKDAKGSVDSATGTADSAIKAAESAKTPQEVQSAKEGLNTANSGLQNSVKEAATAAVEARQQKESVTTGLQDTKNSLKETGELKVENQNMAEETGKLLTENSEKKINTTRLREQQKQMTKNTTTELRTLNKSKDTYTTQKEANSKIVADQKTLISGVEAEIGKLDSSSPTYATQKATLTANKAKYEAELKAAEAKVKEADGKLSELAEQIPQKEAELKDSIKTEEKLSNDFMDIENKEDMYKDQRTKLNEQKGVLEQNAQALNVKENQLTALVNNSSQIEQAAMAAENTAGAALSKGVDAQVQLEIKQNQIGKEQAPATIDD